MKSQSHRNEDLRESETLREKRDKKLIITNSKNLIKPSLATPVEIIDVEYPEPSEKELENNKIVGAIALLLSLVGATLGALPLLSFLGYFGFFSFSLTLFFLAWPIIMIVSIILGLISIFLGIKSHDDSISAILATIVSTVYLGIYFLFWLMVSAAITLLIIALAIFGW